MSRIYVKPVGKARNPQTREVLPADGFWLTLEGSGVRAWQRLLIDGSLVECEAPREVVPVESLQAEKTQEKFKVVRKPVSSVFSDK